jgi:hypothetical protein
MLPAHDERIWFYYAGETQVGPITKVELQAAIREKLLTLRDYVYREGFSDWQVLSTVAELLTPEEDNQATHRTRAPIRELVVAHNDRTVATGHISNISMSGVFLETPSSEFALNEEIKLTLKEGKGLGKPLHLSGVVVRKQINNAGPTGYGLQLKSLDETICARIEDYINRNRAS